MPLNMYQKTLLSEHLKTPNNVFIKSAIYCSLLHYQISTNIKIECYSYKIICSQRAIHNRLTQKLAEMEAVQDSGNEMACR